MEYQYDVEVSRWSEEELSLPLPPITGSKVASFYGFKLVEVEGTSRWVIATEEDYKEAEAHRLGIPLEKVAAKDRVCYCVNVTICVGKCPPGCICKLFRDPASGVGYCACV